MNYSVIQQSLKPVVCFPIYAYARDSVQYEWCKFHHQNSNNKLNVDEEAT